MEGRACRRFNGRAIWASSGGVEHLDVLKAMKVCVMGRDTADAVILQECYWVLGPPLSELRHWEESAIYFEVIAS